jgi:hypothetical protein
MRVGTLGNAPSLASSPRARRMGRGCGREYVDVLGVREVVVDGRDGAETGVIIREPCPLQRCSSRSHTQTKSLLPCLGVPTGCERGPALRRQTTEKQAGVFVSDFSRQVK